MKTDSLLTYFSNPDFLAENHDFSREAEDRPLSVAVPLIQGSYIHFNPPQPKPKTENHICGKRRKISRFSGSSARSISKLFASLDYQGSYFLTLTQAPGFSPQQAKHFLLDSHSSFARSFRERFPEGAFVWFFLLPCPTRYM